MSPVHRRVRSQDKAGFTYPAACWEYSPCSTQPKVGELMSQEPSLPNTTGPSMLQIESRSMAGYLLLSTLRYNWGWCGSGAAQFCRVNSCRVARVISPQKECYHRRHAHAKNIVALCIKAGVLHFLFSSRPEQTRSQLGS